MCASRVILICLLSASQLPAYIHVAIVLITHERCCLSNTADVIKIIYSTSLKYTPCICIYITLLTSNIILKNISLHFRHILNLPKCYSFCIRSDRKLSLCISICISVVNTYKHINDSSRLSLATYTNNVKCFFFQYYLYI